MEDWLSPKLRDDLPFGAEGHFRLHVYRMVWRLLTNLRTAGASSQGSPQRVDLRPFLAQYDSELRAYLPPGQDSGAIDSWWETQIASWEARTPEHLPLRALRDDLALDPEAINILIATLLVDLDHRFGGLFATLQAPQLARRPCIGLLDSFFVAPGATGRDTWPSCRALLEHGLLVVEHQDAPHGEWLVRPPTVIWDAVRSPRTVAALPSLTWQRAEDFPALDALVLPEGLRRQVAHLPGLLHGGQVGALVLRGMTGVGRRTLLGAIARSLGRDLALWQGGVPGDETWRALGPLATLSGALPLLRLQPGPGETIDLPVLPGYRGPVGLALGRSGGLRGPLVERALTLTLPPPDAPARERFWRGTAVPLDPGALATITDRFLFTGGYIHRAAGLAHSYAALDDRETVAVGDVQQATRTLNRQALETLATALEPAGGWSDLVVNPLTTQELQTLEVRCLERERLREHAGAAFATSLTRGVRALFTGPSGTGKTLAARALARELQMDLYRVDLAAVVNKYIGETERNLNQILSAAEELDVVLLLDEGDALMTARTEVRNANDRYANLETNYLLQRLETYEGIVIVTTNAGQRIDEAFLRRLDVTVDFAPPGVAERLLIWRGHLPGDHTLDPAFLDDVAARCVLAGGQIRNAALQATLLALRADAAVGPDHLKAALQREYRKAGAAYPLRDVPPTNGQIDQLRQFAGRLG